MNINDVLVHLLLKQPFYGYVAASVTAAESNEINTINMLTEPNLKLIYNKSWFEALDSEQAVGAIIHELLHVILLHPFRKESREHNLWLIACDMAVNEHIDRKMLHRESITVEKISKEIGEKLQPQKSAEYYYDIISKPGEKSLSFFEINREVHVVLSGGEELKANSSMDSDTSEINKNAVKSMVSDLVEQAKSEGEIPGDVSCYISEIYNSQEINWRNTLKRFLSGKGKIQIRKTCKKESKRFENLPGNKRTVGIDALLAIDESGSITDKQAAKFFSEIASIKKITGTNITVTQFDTECTKPAPLERYVREKKRLKSGGTDFRPVFELADKLHIPLLIIFTDGDGTVPEEVNQRVLWVLTKDGKKPAAYGHSIVFEF